MDDKLFMEVTGKYLTTMSWLNSETLKDVFAIKHILDSAKEYTLKSTGCSVDKFRRLLIDSPILDFEPEDRHIIECYYNYLENIRISRL